MPHLTLLEGNTARGYGLFPQAHRTALQAQPTRALSLKGNKPETPKLLCIISKCSLNPPPFLQFVFGLGQPEVCG